MFFSLSRLKLVEAIQLLEDSRDPFRLPSPRPTGLLFASGFLEGKSGSNHERRYHRLTCKHSPANHRVTQSSFGSPCEPLRGGFDSGWIVGQEGIGSSFAEWNLTIMDDSERRNYLLSINSRWLIHRHLAAIWFYCKQLAPIPQCKAEMVG
jgi:hypothetical protein